jgi:hypothetical protein
MPYKISDSPVPPTPAAILLKERFDEHRAHHPYPAPATDYGDYKVSMHTITCRKQFDKLTTQYLSHIGYKMAASHDCSTRKEFPTYYWIPAWCDKIEEVEGKDD